MGSEAVNSLTIGELARQAHISVETIRYYERRGLIPPPPRRPSGYRQYPHDTVTRIRFIKQAQQLGFSLREIRELLALRLDPNTTCENLRVRAEAKLVDIEDRLESLQRMREALMRLIEQCRRGQVPRSICPIVDALEHGLTDESA